MKKPVLDPEFWRKRIMQAAATGRGTHTAIYEIDPDTWQYIQNDTKRILSDHLKPHMVLLDAGCGYGAASSYMPRGVGYCGVDLSPELIEIAKLAYPTTDFRVARLEHLPFLDGTFDFALCRSIRGMILDNVGQDAWDAIERELLRVAGKIIVIEYEGLPNYWMIPGGKMR